MKFGDFFNDNSIIFGSLVELQSTNPREMNISEIFNINSSLISEFGDTLLSNDIPDGLKKVLTEISWAIRAYNGYQDIFDYKISLTQGESKDNTDILARQMLDFNRDYCYFESIAYLKEAFVCLLNGNMLATIVLLRPFLELSIANIYWTLKSDRESTYSFYKWLLGSKRHKQSFSKMLDYYYLNCEPLTLMDKNGLDKNKKSIKELYRELCSYNHMPFLDESIISHAGNIGKKSHDFFKKLILLIKEILFHVNLIYLLKYPMALFPQDIYRHFGYYGGPVGLFFDEFNYAIIERYFGKEEIMLLTKALRNYGPKEDLVNFIQGYRQLNEEEMEQSWQEFVTENSNKREDFDIKDHAARVTLCKARLRGFRLSTSYIRNIDLKQIDLSE